MKKFLALAAVALCAAAGTAQAALIVVPLKYQVDFVDASVSAQLGLSAGSMLEGAATYDDTGTPGALGDYTVSSFTLSFGTLNFTEASDDSGFGAGIVPPLDDELPSLYFQTSFTLDGGSGNGSYLLVFDGTSGRLTPSGNTFDFVLTASAVPVPAPAVVPLVLAGLGLMGLAGARQRRR